MSGLVGVPRKANVEVSSLAAWCLKELWGTWASAVGLGESSFFGVNSDSLLELRFHWESVPNFQHQISIITIPNEPISPQK